MIYGLFARVRARADLEELKPYQAALNISMQRDHMYSFSKQTYHFYMPRRLRLSRYISRSMKSPQTSRYWWNFLLNQTSLILMFVEKCINIKISRACLVVHHQGLHGQLHLPANQMPQNIPAPCVKPSESRWEKAQLECGAKNCGLPPLHPQPRAYDKIDPSVAQGEATLSSQSTIPIDANSASSVGVKGEVQR